MTPMCDTLFHNYTCHYFTLPGDLRLLENRHYRNAYLCFLSLLYMVVLYEVLNKYV